MIHQVSHITYMLIITAIIGIYVVYHNHYK